MIIDAHCHLTDPRLELNRETLISQGIASGISCWVFGGVDAAEWERQRALVKKHPNRFVPVFGIHPWTVAQESSALLEPQWSQLKEYAHEAQAIGETGLDFAPRLEATREKQTDWFLRHLELANQLQKPLVLHIVRAHSEALEILKVQKPALSGLVHAFTGDATTAHKYLDLGFVPSIGARVTYPKSTALRDFVKKARLEEFVVETDCPDQPPAGHAEPMHGPESLFQIAQTIADLRERESSQEILAASAENLLKVFAPWKP